SMGVLPGVDVTVTQTDTGFRRSVVTDETGSYTLSNLPIGPYRLDVTLAGFRSFQQTGIVLQVNANPVIGVTLELGNVAETVVIEAAAPLVETRSPSIGQVIENERIEELPLNGRNAADLIVLAGAAVRPGVATDASSRAMQGGVGYAVAGGQTFGVAYLLDGAMHNNPYDNLNLPLPFPDAMQEFRVETNSTTAQNGMHSGASVNAVTKSGTNLFHGDIFEFVRNHRFNATDPFARIVNGERLDDGLSRNQYGGTFGGPIATDRIFFFGAYQGTRIRQRPADVFAFIPTQQMLSGDFTTFASAQCNAAGDITLRAPFVNNRIDPRLFSPAALRIVDRLGATTTHPCGRVNYSTARPEDHHQYIGKVDVQLSTSHSIFGRYMMTTAFFAPPFAETGNILSTNLGGRDNSAQSLTIGDTMVLSSNTVNSIRFAWNYTDIHRTHEPFGFSAPDVGIKTYSYLDKYMLLNITNGFQIGGGTESEATYKT
ncbi:MAG: carboxypeptidase regulatory-like domain-containing protein, partial [Vicinamibacterales bacterium]